MNLFVQPPRIDPADYLPAAEAQKCAAVRLTSPPQQWDDEILQTLIREHPFIPPERVIVNFRQKDDVNGTALGNISLSGSPRVSIPVIIKNRELSPFDVFIVRSSADTDVDQGAGDFNEDEVRPLNEENFTQALDAGDIGEPVPDLETQDVGYSEDGSALRLPFHGRTVLASYMGASPEKRAEAVQLIAGNREVQAGFLLNGHDEVVISWLEAPNPQKLAQQKLAGTEVNRSLAITLQGRPVQIATADFNGAQVFVDDGSAKMAAAIDCIDLASPERGTQRLLLFADGTYCNAPEKVAALVQEDVSEETVLASVAEKVATVQAFARGATVMFQADGVFTRPATIQAIMANEQTKSARLTMADDLGRNYFVTVDPRVKQASRGDDGHWVIPMGQKILELNNAAAERPMALEKVAEYFQRRLPDSLQHADGQFQLTIRGDAFGGVQMDEAKVAHVLNSWVLNGSSLIEQAKRDGFVRFQSEIPTQVDGLVKLANRFHALPGLGAKVVAEVGIPLDKAIKLAAVIGDPEGVDAILGAGFLTEDNVAEFTNLTDLFEEVIGKLSRLLLAIRMGFPGDENATVVAMKSLQRVVDYLHTAIQEITQ